jgi:hypothetical protein
MKRSAELRYPQSTNRAGLSRRTQAFWGLKRDTAARDSGEFWILGRMRTRDGRYTIHRAKLEFGMLATNNLLAICPDGVSPQPYPCAQGSGHRAPLGKPSTVAGPHWLELGWLKMRLAVVRGQPANTEELSFDAAKLIGPGIGRHGRFRRRALMGFDKLIFWRRLILYS